VYLGAAASIQWSLESCSVNTASEPTLLISLAGVKYAYIDNINAIFRDFYLYFRNMSFLLFSLTGMGSSSSTDSLVCVAVGPEGVQKLHRR